MSLRIKSSRYCLFCGYELYGRFDKKFCNDNCRNNYHYHLRNDDSLVKKMNSILLTNREILKSLCVGRKTVVEKQCLDKRCFNYELITNLYKTCAGTEYRVVYDYAYKLLNDEQVLLMKFI